MVDVPPAPPTETEARPPVGPGPSPGTTGHGAIAMTRSDPTATDPAVRPYPTLGDHHGGADDDAHDRGLLHDLSVLAARRVALAAGPVRVNRRRVLALLGGAGAGLVLAACGSKGSSDAAASATTGATTLTTLLGGSSSTTAASSSSGATVTDAIPEETGGPYPADGSNGPDVLTESGIVRSDITTSFGDYSGTAEGLPLGVDLTVVHAGDGSPYAGAALYLWHADKDGHYSLYTAADQNYLRGVQEAGADGTLSFSTIYPGCYDGRWPHMHFEVYPSLDDATSAGTRLVTSQLAMPEDTCHAVYDATAGYETSVDNLSRTSLATDMVFSDGVDLQLPTVSGTPDGGDLRIALTVAVNG